MTPAVTEGGVVIGVPLDNGPFNDGHGEPVRRLAISSLVGACTDTGLKGVLLMTGGVADFARSFLFLMSFALSSSALAFNAILVAFCGSRIAFLFCGIY